MPGKQDTEIIRELAAQTAEIAALPAQEEKRRLWRQLNARKPGRPLVMIDQVCWHEMNVNDELTERCTDPECRRYETSLRRSLYQWRHFPVDMVVEPFVRVPKAIYNTGFGITNSTGNRGGCSQRCIGPSLFQPVRDRCGSGKDSVPRITHDPRETERRLAVAHDLFDGFLEAACRGHGPLPVPMGSHQHLMGVETALFALMERPEFMHRLAARMTEGYLAMLDQLEEQGLLCGPQSLIHCTGAYTDELPASDYRPERPRTKDLWMFGLAQMFSTVSPATFREYEVVYTSRICERFGLVYYGCCDPLDGKMNEVRQIPNVRKISMSPWANEERGAEAIGRDYVFSRKPNPAFLAYESFDPEQVRSDLLHTRAVCEKHGCPLEFILKDISTVRYHPERLGQWAEIAMEVVRG